MTKTVLFVSLALAAGASQAGWESWLRDPLYLASFETYSRDQELSDAGAINGTWGDPAVPYGAEAKAASIKGPSQYIKFSTGDAGIVFTPSSTGTRVLKTVSTSAQLSSYGEDCDLPDLKGANPRGAFAIHAPANSATNFVGWTASGWTNLTASSVGAVPGRWYDVLMKFAQFTNGTVNVQYLVKQGSGAYVTLRSADDPDVTWFKAGGGASDAIVSKVEFRGEGAFSRLSGSEPRRGLFIGLMPWREMLIDEKEK